MQFGRKSSEGFTHRPFVDSTQTSVIKGQTVHNWTLPVIDASGLLQVYYMCSGHVQDHITFGSHL